MCGEICGTLLWERICFSCVGGEIILMVYRKSDARYVREIMESKVTERRETCMTQRGLNKEC